MSVTDWAQRFLEDVYARPDARAPRVRYGAALRSRGDPLGDLIGWEVDGNRPRAQQARAELWPRLRGDLPDEVTLVETWLGFPKTVRGPLRAPHDALRTVERVEGASTLHAAMPTLGALKSIEVASADDLETLLLEDVHVKSVWPLRVRTRDTPVRFDGRFRADQVAIDAHKTHWRWAQALAAVVEHVHADTWEPPPQDFDAGSTRVSWRGGGEPVDIIPCSRAHDLLVPEWFRFEPIELLWRMGPWRGVLGLHEGEPQIAVLVGGETEHQRIALHAASWAHNGPGPWNCGPSNPVRLCTRAMDRRPNVNVVSELFDMWCDAGGYSTLILGNPDYFLRTEPGLFDIERLLLSRMKRSGTWAAHNTSGSSAWWADPDRDVWVVTQGYESGRPVAELAYPVLDAFSVEASFPQRVDAICRAAQEVDPRCGWVSLLALGRHEGRLHAAGIGIKAIYRLRGGAFQLLSSPDTLGLKCAAEGVTMTAADPGYFVPVRMLKAGERGDLDVVEIDARAGDRLVLCVGGAVDDLSAEQVHRCVATGSPRDAACALDAAGEAVAGSVWWSAFAVVDV